MSNIHELETYLRLKYPDHEEGIEKGVFYSYIRNEKGELIFYKTDSIGELNKVKSCYYHRTWKFFGNKKYHWLVRTDYV
jgi:hypothetical protein